LNNKTTDTFDKLLRIDSRDYPETALREALLKGIIVKNEDMAASLAVLTRQLADSIAESMVRHTSRRM